MKKLFFIFAFSFTVASAFECKGFIKDATDFKVRIEEHIKDVNIATALGDIERIKGLKEENSKILDVTRHLISAHGKEMDSDALNATIKVLKALETMNETFSSFK